MVPEELVIRVGPMWVVLMVVLVLLYCIKSHQPQQQKQLVVLLVSVVKPYLLGPGTLENTSGSPLSVEYFAIAGGGAGGVNNPGGTVTGGGGGAGGVVAKYPIVPATNPEPDVGPGSPHKLTITIGAGGGGKDFDDAAVMLVLIPRLLVQTLVRNCLWWWRWWRQ